MADQFFDESIKTLMEVTGQLKSYFRSQLAAAFNEKFGISNILKIGLDLEGAKKVLKFRENNLDAAINYILDGNDIPEIVDDDVVITAARPVSVGPSTSSSSRVVSGPNMPAIVSFIQFFLINS